MTGECPAIRLTGRPRLLEKIRYTDDLFEIRVEKDHIPYRSGDCTMLVHKDHISARPYSFASHPSDPWLAFVFKRFPDGVLTRYLAALEPGDELIVGPAFGRFAPEVSRPAVFVATGTGIAPFLSYLKAPTATPPVVLLYGARSRTEALYADWLTARCPVELFLSREAAREQAPDRGCCFAGRVTAHPQRLPVNAGYAYYLCGHGDMIRTLSTRLLNAGVPETQIHGELFFP